jgi:hypothetical protein
VYANASRMHYVPWKIHLFRNGYCLRRIAITPSMPR